MRYYHKHTLVALAIQQFIWLTLTMILMWVVGLPFSFASMIAWTAGCFSGAFFYAGREYVQWEKYEPSFDWPGLLWPVLTMTILYILYMVI